MKEAEYFATQAWAVWPIGRRLLLKPLGTGFESRSKIGF